MGNDFDYSFTNRFNIGDRVRVVSFEGKPDNSFYGNILVIKSVTCGLSSLEGNIISYGYITENEHRTTSSHFENELELVKTKEMEIINDPKFSGLFL